MDYFTSDLHIGHNKDFLWGKRGFSSIEEHDTEILERWNNTVWPEDTVYILGDLCMSDNKYEWDRVYKNLNGKKFFIIGNHDSNNKIIRYENEYNITNLGLSTIYKYNKRKIFLLSHYPTIVGNFKEEKFFYNLSGHTHSTDPFQFMWGNVYNVALDAHNCTPVSIEQIIEDIKDYRQKQEGEKK